MMIPNHPQIILLTQVMEWRENLPDLGTGWGRRVTVSYLREAVTRQNGPSGIFQQVFGNVGYTMLLHSSRRLKSRKHLIDFRMKLVDFSHETELISRQKFVRHHGNYQFDIPGLFYVNNTCVSKWACELLESYVFDGYRKPIDHTSHLIATLAAGSEGNLWIQHCHIDDLQDTVSC